MTIDEAIVILRKFKDGKPLEVMIPVGKGGQWEDVPNFLYSDEVFLYLLAHNRIRVKPEPRHFWIHANPAKAQETVFHNFYAATAVVAKSGGYLIPVVEVIEDSHEPPRDV